MSLVEVHRIRGASVQCAVTAPSVVETEVRAAIAGQGVALARSVLAADEIASGRLVRPFDVDVPAEYAYYLAYPEKSADQSNVMAFREWILEEARAGGNRG